MAEEIIIAIIGLIGGGSVSSFVFWRISKRKALAEARRLEEEAKRANIDNVSAIGDQWQELYNELRERLDKEEAKWKEELDNERQNFEKERDRAEKIYSDYLSLREDKDGRIRDLTTEIHALRNKYEAQKDDMFKKDLEIDRLKAMKCEVRGCANRRPPSDLML